MQEATATVASKKAFEFSIQSLMEKTRSPTGNSGSTSLTSPTSPALQNPQVMGGLHAANQFLLNLAALSSLQEAFMDNLRQGGGGVVMSPTHPAFAGALPSSLPGFMASYPVDNGALTAAVGAMRRGHILSPESRNMNHCMTSSFKRQHPDSFRAASAMDFGHSSSSASSVMQGLSKPKRIRTAFSPGQLVQLEAAFDNNPYVVGQERRDLASQLNLTETQVKVWFQNRRTKQKRGRSEGEEEETIIIHE